MILNDDSLKCWGWGEYGQLGQDNANDNIGDDSGEMAALDAVELGMDGEGNPYTAKAVSVGGLAYD